MSKNLETVLKLNKIIRSGKLSEEMEAIAKKIRTRTIEIQNGPMSDSGLPFILAKKFVEEHHNILVQEEREEAANDYTIFDF